jgi:hypothetical protein
MGYLLPIPNFQSNQDLIRSLQKKQHFSYIQSVQNVNLQNQFDRESNRENRYTNVDNWRKIPRLNKQNINITPHNSSNDLVFLNTEGKGLYFDFYV